MERGDVCLAKCRFARIGSSSRRLAEILLGEVPDWVPASVGGVPIAHSIFSSGAVRRILTDSG